MSVDGVPHLISAAASGPLLALARAFDLVWCSGWEEKADEHLAPALCLPVRPPFLTFQPPQANVHWKLGGVGATPAGRPLAWIDDAFAASCHAWAPARRAPTLLVA